MKFNISNDWHYSENILPFGDNFKSTSIFWAGYLILAGYVISPITKDELYSCLCYEMRHMKAPGGEWHQHEYVIHLKHILCVYIPKHSPLITFKC